MSAEDRLRDALQRRADEVEPSPDAYARLAHRVDAAQRRHQPWWQTPQLLWLTAAAGGAAVVVLTVVLALSGGDGSDEDEVTTAQDPTPVATAEPQATPDEPAPTSEPVGTPEAPAGTPTPLATPEPTPDDPRPVGRPDGVIWPTDSTAPFGEWHQEPGVAAREFVTALTGYELPIGDVQVLDPSAMVAEVTLQSVGEDGQPFGEAMRVRLAGGIDPTTGLEQWGVVSGSSDRILIDGWNFIGAPPSFEPQGRGLAFEGTIDVRIVDQMAGLWGEGFVMGGGTELAPLTGSVPFGPAPAARGFAIFSDLGGLGIAPTALTIIPVEWPEFADSQPCSAAGESFEPRTDLPAPVEQKREAIAAAAIACDYDSLAALVSPDGFTYSFGGGDDPATFWREAEQRGGEPLRFLLATLAMPEAFDQEFEPATYIWPRVFTEEWSEVTPAERAALVPPYTEADLDSWDSFGGFVGYRIGITEDGEWIYFVAGD